MKRTAWLFLIIFLSFSVHAKELKGEKKPTAFGYPELYYIDNGPVLDDADFAKLGIANGGRVVGAYYRVGFINSEIYTSFIVELISFGEEGSDVTVRETYFLNSFSVADTIGESRILHSTFVAWDSPRSFRVDVGTKEKPYVIKIHIGRGGIHEIVVAK